MTKTQVEECLARYVRGLPPNVPVPKHVFDLWNWMENGQQDNAPPKKMNGLAPVVPIDIDSIIKRKFLKSNN